MQKEAESPQKNVRPKENPSTEKYGKEHFVKSVFLSFFSLNKSFKPQKSQKINALLKMEICRLQKVHKSRKPTVFKCFIYYYAN